MGNATEVDAPLVADCPVVLECRVFKEVDLGTAPNALIIGEVVAVDLGPEARELWDDGFLDTRGWKPVGRLWAGLYSLVESTHALERPKIDRTTGEAS
jgi:flavin reductase (DIM6/NTAB) family NADH-FMN oxidoreductase RutF